MDPPIEAFIPNKIFTEDSQVETRDLKDLIEDVEVADAVLVYNLLQKNNIEIPADLKQSFYELICFYNCEEQLDGELIEERWFRQDVRQKERSRKTWKDHDLAEQIFNEAEPKDSRVYSTIIRGMCKFYQVEKAWALYNDAIAKNIELDVGTFNAIIEVSSSMKESSELRWDLILELLNTMRSMKVDPNLGTLNACLATIKQMGGPRPKEYCLKIIAEFKRIGIEPSLGSWFCVLHTFCKDRGPVSHVIIDILNQIEGKEFTIRDQRDTSFFVTAMDVCRNHLFDKNLAKRVDALLHVGNNYNLIGDSIKESIYYRNFFALMVATEPLESFMELYHRLVPNVYIPEPVVMEEILKAVETSGAIEHVPLFWSHIVLFDQITRENLLTILTRIMIQNQPNAAFPQQEGLVEKFGEIAYAMYTKIEERNESRSNPFVWSGKLLSDIITLLCKIGDFDKASEVYEKLSLDQQKVLGEPEISALVDFVQLCISKKQPSKAISCLVFSNDVGFPETRDLAKSIVKGFTLDENHLRKVTFVAGQEAVSEAQDEQQKEAEQLKLKLAEES